VQRLVVASSNTTPHIHTHTTGLGGAQTELQQVRMGKARRPVGGGILFPQLCGHVSTQISGNQDSYRTSPVVFWDVLWCVFHDFPGPCTAFYNTVNTSFLRQTEQAAEEAVN